MKLPYTHNAFERRKNGYIMANKVPMTTSIVTAEQAKLIHELAASLNVSLNRFPENCVPTAIQVRHCAKINDVKRASGETIMGLYYGSDGQSWVAAQKSNAKVKAASNVQNMHFVGVDLADDIAAVIGWLGGSSNAKQGTAMRAIDNSSEGTYLDEKTGTIHVSLQNGQKFTILVTEVKAPIASIAPIAPIDTTSSASKTAKK